MECYVERSTGSTGDKLNTDVKNYEILFDKKIVNSEKIIDIDLFAINLNYLYSSS